MKNKMNEEKLIKGIFAESARLIDESNELHSEILIAVGLIRKCLKNNKKVILFGNGGSAADAQHMAAEFIGRFKKNRISLPAISLTTDSSIITSVGNDYSFADIFVLPTLDEGRKEGCPVSLLEAMACGLPVVCSNAASLPEIVSDSGLMSDPEDAFKLSEQVLAVLNNKELRNSLIQKGYKNSERFSWRDNIEKTIALYNKVLDQDSNKTKKIVFFQRKFPFYGSIELNFSELRNWYATLIKNFSMEFLNVYRIFIFSFIIYK